MQRLFIAVPIPDHEKEKLLNLHINIPGIRWIEKDQSHMTLARLKSVQTNRVCN